jgi:hypothetical protein
MKNNNILIAAFAILILAAVSVRAGEVVDFDGKSVKKFTFSQALGAAEFVKIDPIKSEKEDAELPGRAVPEFTQAQVKEMDKSIGTAIMYVREQKLPADLEGNFNCLLQKGTPEQKAALVYRPEGSVYTFPQECSGQNKGVCSWVTDKVCEYVINDAGARVYVCEPVKWLFCGEATVPAK